MRKYIVERKVHSISQGHCCSQRLDRRTRGDVSAINACDMKDDAFVPFIVNNAPRISFLGVTALHAAIINGFACFLEP